MRKKKVTLSAPGPWPDVLRGLLLALATVLLWCAHFDRWTAESWNTPLEYLESPETGDVIAALAGVKAAEDGHLWPFIFINIPELGAPGSANWNDYPTPEKIIFLLAGGLAHLVGIFAAANLLVLFSYVLTTVCFYTAARMLDCHWVWALAGAIIFGFARYSFGHSLHHVTVLYDALVPLELIVFEWILRGEGLPLRGRRFAIALIVAVATGCLNVYYSYLFLQFVFFGALYQVWLGGWRRALPAVCVMGSTLASAVVMNLNTILYHLVNGPAEAVVRPYKWIEAYGLKLVDLVVPPPDHPFPPFAEWGADHLRSVILPVGESPITGYLGLVSLAALAWLVFVSVQAAAERKPLPLATYLILWIVLFGNVGGLNAIGGTLGFTLIRSTTRYGIVIMCVVLFFAARRLSAVKWGEWPILAYVAACLLTVFAWWDQTPPALTAEDLQNTAEQVASDQKFTDAMVQALPPGAMVFQFPIMDFPESPAPGVGAYDHFRPYLYTDALHFSFGSDKGRTDTSWQHQLGEEPFDDVISELQAKGFAALYINRKGFQDNGAGIVKAIQDQGYTQKIDSDKGDLVCVILKKG